MAHLAIRRYVDANRAYVAVSRAEKYAATYTDDRDGLASNIKGRTGTHVGAIDEARVKKRPATATPVHERRHSAGDHTPREAQPACTGADAFYQP